VAVTAVETGHGGTAWIQSWELQDDVSVSDPADRSKAESGFRLRDVATDWGDTTAHETYFTEQLLTTLVIDDTGQYGRQQMFRGLRVAISKSFL
jgi:hypothetical protein